MLDARDNNGRDITFKVSVDGNPTQYQEEQKQIGAIGRAEVVGKIDYREITLFVPKNSKVIDIIGTNTSEYTLCWWLIQCSSRAIPKCKMMTSIHKGQVLCAIMKHHEV